MRRASLVVLFSAALLASAPVAAPVLAAPTAATAESRLADAFKLFAEQTDGTVGVAVQAVDGKAMATLNAGTTFPMASTFKIAVAGRIFERIDKSELTLEQMVTVDPKLLVGSYGMAIQTPHPGIALSVYNLLEFMLTQSDNTSTDVLVQLAGGPAAVTAWLRAQGISGQRVDSDTAHLIYRAMGIENPSLPTFKENVEAAYKADPALRDRGPNVPFNADPRDASTPEAMVQLLLRIHSGKAMSAKSTRTLIGIMERCRTGEKRLKGLLPPDPVVAHKTGTLSSVANDVGIVTLPNGRQFAIAVFVKGDTKGTATQDKVIADIARVAYDHFLTVN
ncbi:MAG: class A beta-lactamase [Sphingomonadaceae bacterium]|nr:class A beta-lactamase [Sphingomonadaceae bacterium]